MFKTIISQAVSAATHAGIGGRLSESRFNMKLGFALLRDRRVSFWAKVGALGAGVAIAAGLVALEVPPEALLAFAMPGLGLALDFATDGLEALIVPACLAALILPFIAHRGLVDQVIQERSGAPTVAPALLSTAHNT